MSIVKLQTYVCVACRLHQAILSKECLRSKAVALTSSTTTRSFRTSRPHSIRQRADLNHVNRSRSQRSRHTQESTGALPLAVDHEPAQSLLRSSNASAEDIARRARETYGDRLPDDLLNEEQEKVYERLYGEPFRRIEEIEQPAGSHSSNQVMLEPDIYESDELDEEEFNSDREDEDDEQADGTADIDLREDNNHATGSVPRAHHLTFANRFGSFPSTIQIPKDSVVQPIHDLTAGVASTHIIQSAIDTFGGKGLPDSTSTPAFAKTRQQLPIPLNVSQVRMSGIEADTFLHALVPAFYASIFSVLVETRKRLGTAWAEGLVKKAEAGQLRILDAGGAGTGILAVRRLLKAEWERMIEERTTAQDYSHAIAQPNGKLGGAGIEPPLGNATVHIASNTLRHRASQLLENTTFIPRLPDYIHTEDAKHAGKYDIILATHTIWPIQENWERKTHVQNLWALLNADGGVLCLLEKGVARGFEAVAEARKVLLETKIRSSPASQIINEDSLTTTEDDAEPDLASSPEKEAGMIIAPCSHHTQCPMYFGEITGTIKGRKDICHFKQRYIRPPLLQRIFGARDRNHEDVKFSYLAVMRGIDMRSTSSDRFSSEPLVEQGEEAASRAKVGYEQISETDDAKMIPSSMSLPRMILPPLKRKGHVIIDVCSPSGKLERWTVPRSFSKQAFRDARKSAWGDLWALGAKTRISKQAKLGKHARKVEPEKQLLSKKRKKEKRRVQERKPGKQGKILDME